MATPLGSKKSITAAIAGVTVLLGFWLVNGTRLFESAEASARVAINAHCIDCHDSDPQSGGLILNPASLADIREHADVWEAVVRKLDTRSMPPPEEPRPDEATYRTMQRFLESRLDSLAASEPKAGELPQLHRLTRTQYGNTVRDLLELRGLPSELDFTLLLPADNSSSGFDNIAELLFVSPGIMERYLDAATKISRLAIGDMNAPVLVNRHRLPLQQPQDEHVAGLPLGTRGGFAVDSYLPLDAEYRVRVEFASGSRTPHQIEILIDGERKAIAPVAPAGGRGFPRRPPPLEFSVSIAAGPARIGVTFVEKTQALDESTLREKRRSRGNLPSIEIVTVSGPYDATGPGDTPSRTRIFVCQPESATDERACAGEILSNLAQRAYRRPVDARDLDDLWPFFDAGRAERGFDFGIQRALERLLISPQFLYRIELDPPAASPGEAYSISDLELASRLSFFLWSSIPDEKLLDLAIAGRLREPGELEQQVERMLADPKSKSLVTNFAAQWLFLRDVQSKEPDLFLFRDYDTTLKESLVRETELFLASIFDANRSVVDLLDATHTFVNERLAEHYGIPNIEGSHFRRIELPEDSPRAGLLGKAGILTLTSYSTRTSPVLRGKYVLDNLLASPPPPPPPDVPSLVTENVSDGAALTMREALARHRADPACASCHVEMDAIGFALENFDAVGQWRDWDAGEPIDSISVFPDGTPIEGVAGLRTLLTSKPERFASAFTEKLLMYAIGRNVQHYDAPAVRSVVRTAEANDYAFVSIVKGIVGSVPFQMRTAKSGENLQ